MRNAKDFWAGVLFLAFGIAALAIALSSGYEFGNARKMGPGYFPIWLGAGLGIVGIVLAIRGIATAGPSLGRIAWWPLLVITAGTVAFAVLFSYAGLAPAIFTLVLAATLASIHFRLGYAIPLALGLAVAAVLIFVKGLGLPIPVMPHVLGY